MEETNPNSCLTTAIPPHSHAFLTPLPSKTGSQSFLETVALSSSPSDPHLPLTVFDLVRTECLGSLYGMLALALHGLGIVEEEAGDEGDLPSSGTKTSGFSGPVSSDLDASSLVPRVASMVVSGSEDESDGKDYPRPSVLSGRRDGEGEKMNLAANRARDEPSHLCITLPCKMPLGQDVTVSLFLSLSQAINRKESIRR